MPKVSVIVPTYNRPVLASAAVASALGQTYGDIEVIVVDDGSTDGTADRLEAEFGSRISLLRLERNQGRSAARNAGWRAAAGELVALLDSDDLWLPEKLAVQVPLFDDPGVAIVHGFVTVIDGQGTPLKRATMELEAHYRAAMKRGYSYLGMSEHCIMYSSSVAVRRDVLEKMGGYDTSILGLEDLDMYLLASLQGSVRTCECVVAMYRQHAGNTPNDTMALARIQVCKKHLRLLDQHPDWPDARIARRNFCLNLASAHAVLRQRNDARRWMLSAVRLDPTAVFQANWRRLAATTLAPRWMIDGIRAYLRPADGGE